MEFRTEEILWLREHALYLKYNEKTGMTRSRVPNLQWWFLRLMLRLLWILFFYINLAMLLVRQVFWQIKWKSIKSFEYDLKWSLWNYQIISFLTKWTVDYTWKGGLNVRFLNQIKSNTLQKKCCYFVKFEWLVCEFENGSSQDLNY